MKIVYIRKRVLVNILTVFVIVALSVLYAKGIGKNTISAFLNNEKVIPIHCVELPDKRVALTFDTAWGDQYIKEIVDTLKRYNINATFFLTGSWIDKYPEIAKEVVNSGHEIGNHSSTHIKMTELPKDEIIREVKETDNRIAKITGKKSSVFRFPFGEYNDKAVKAVKDTGCNIIQWDIDSYDWKGVSTEDIYTKVTLKADKGSIILFHSNMTNTHKALPVIIEMLRKDGYKFVTVSELLLKENYYIDNTGRQKSLK